LVISKPQHDGWPRGKRGKSNVLPKRMQGRLTGKFGNGMMRRYQCGEESNTRVTKNEVKLNYGHREGKGGIQVIFGTA